MNTQNIFGQRLKQLRIKLNFTQKQMADKIGITPATLSAYENGTNQPSFSVCKQIAIATSTSLDWLCGLKDDVTKHSYNNLYEVLNDLVNALEVFDITINLDSYNDSLCYIHIDNYVSAHFLSSWAKMKELYDQSVIDENIYKAWLKGELEKYKKYEISTSDNKYYIIDPDLPF